MEKISDFEWEIPVEDGMNVPGLIFASDATIEVLKGDRTLEQVRNVAKLPGILKASFAMPDAHQGYGFPIGGVAAFDLEKGVISPGGVGYDINCGVRILATNISESDFLAKRKEALHDFRRSIPSGVGRGNSEKLSDSEMDDIFEKGARYAVEKGFGVEEDLVRCEEGGCVCGVNVKDVSNKARGRGRRQLGTLGAGNHFLEVLRVDEIFDDSVAKVFGVEKGNVVVMIHCGSRGLGHQVASDYIQKMDGLADFPDKELVNAPISSEVGQAYLSAMNCAVNFAFCNRQMIMHRVREVMGRHFEGFDSHLVYDVCHNIAKVEKHLVDGEMKEVCVHRKGATRAFGPGRKEVPEVYREVGQPVLIPGSMGTASYLLVGTKESEEIAFSSTAHGAGRVLSRSAAKKSIEGKKVQEDLAEQGILVEAGNVMGISEEAPEVYKDIEEIVRISDGLGLARKVARLKPLAVMKG